ncbi:hypothetical protein PY093_21000 [Cytobacillus sp. S13-E01]|uniref:hypothetical protein n=1 Tax=Cytobacillus sp. S13-E01 TaxID=3031326 RepID=UPI0023D862C0|nr:hypothetical protein [Cytobacillus sp. S13-E01]MDF0729088.1 hypothetical protein [Cytobacillus sp. S13-E01]
MNLPIYKIDSPVDGTVEKVYVEDNSYLYEWEQLFLLKASDGRLQYITIGISGYITSLMVKEGDKVSKNTILALLKDDYIISGSD